MSLTRFNAYHGIKHPERWIREQEFKGQLELAGVEKAEGEMADPLVVRGEVVS